MRYQIKIADLVLVNSVAIALQIDFQILSQIARASDRESSNISQRALIATNDIMNTFRRRDEDISDPAILDDVIVRCREISQSVLGPLDKGAQKKLCTHDAGCFPEAKIWAIGHW
jgi:hypothetical protein